MAVTIRPGPADRHERLLPYDRGNPVFFDNDFANDYVDWYLMAAASAGELRYRGISTSSSVAPFNRTLPKDYFLERCVGDRARIVQIGRRCGVGNVPNPVAGPLGYLVEPGSGTLGCKPQHFWSDNATDPRCRRHAWNRHAPDAQRSRRSPRLTARNQHNSRA
jgi:hypothetical protein